MSEKHEVEPRYREGQKICSLMLKSHVTLKEEKVEPTAYSLEELPKWLENLANEKYSIYMDLELMKDKNVRQ